MGSSTIIIFLFPLSLCLALQPLLIVALESNNSTQNDNYMDASEQLDDSVAALTANAYKDVRVWVQVAISDAQSCEQGYTTTSGKVVVAVNSSQ
ncbi:hypothetical protein Patl1_00972 [Pistacia atlantica]|uniref:Uncharacterized protein n=1 Tax=Pistacia atlantica TaxID=434234 RepID=A0ACC1CA53_9ROSI|nr:hypothetical protein Patl1_00972 [Pistacia atlantica]